MKGNTPNDPLAIPRAIYHFALAFLGAFFFGFPSKRLVVVGVTGTKGKSSTLEYLNAIFEAAGWKTALLGTIRIKIGEDTHPNTARMTMPGRFRTQRFLKEAADAGCNIAFLEMTSEGSRQFRHRFIELDAFLFINLSPEHIESHGSLEAYADAKFEIAKQLVRSKKRPRYLVVNEDDGESTRYLTLPVEHVLPYSLQSVSPFESRESGGFFTFEGERISLALPGTFSIQNALAACTLARAMGIQQEIITRGVHGLSHIPGRAEEIRAGQAFTVVIDYAHTPDSLRAIYSAYPRRKICVLGSTGGGRDVWKRPEMGSIAARECDVVILTNEDPYDEDPRSIVEAIAGGMGEKTPEIIMDRRDAIAHALSLARASDVVLITGKGTDPTIQGPGGTNIPWDDARVAREEIEKLLKK